nr:uncharacterized protein LOC106681152 [Halyomorpha halys]
MDKGEDLLDRNQEAPVSSYDMGIYDYDIIPDPYSPKFLRERSITEKGVNNKEEKKKKRHHCHHHHHRAQSSENTTSGTESEPNIRKKIEPSTNSLLSYNIGKHQTLKYYATCAGFGLFAILLFLTVIHYYGQQLDRLFSCDRTRFNAVAYNERGLMYYLCKTLKVIRNPGVTFLEH